MVEIHSHLTSSVVEREVGGCDLLDFPVLSVPVASVSNRRELYGNGRIN